MTPKKADTPAKAYPAPSSGLRSGAVIEVKAGVFKDTCLQLLDDVRDRRIQLTVTKYGEPVAWVVAPDSASASAFGFMSGTVLGQDDIVAPDPEAWGELK